LLSIALESHTFRDGSSDIGQHLVTLIIQQGHQVIHRPQLIQDFDIRIGYGTHPNRSSGASQKGLIVPYVLVLNDRNQGLQAPRLPHQIPGIPIEGTLIDRRTALHLEFRVFGTQMDHNIGDHALGGDGQLEFRFR